MNGKGMEFDIFHVHIAQDVVFCVRPPPHIGSPWSNANVYLWPPTKHEVKGLEPSRPKYLKRIKFRAPTMHMLSRILYLVLPLIQTGSVSLSLRGREEQQLESKQGTSQQKESTLHPLCCCGLSSQDSILIFTHHEKWVL